MNHIRALHAVALVAVAASTALAQESTPAPTAAPAETSRPVKFRFQGKAENTFDTYLKDGPGETSVFRTGPSLDVAVPIGERATLTIAASAEFSKYRFKDVTAFGAGGPKPIRNTFEHEFNISYSRQIDDKWSFFVAAGVNAAGEHGASFSDSLTYGGGGGVTYKVDEKFDIGLGAIVRTRLEENTYVMPLPIFTWKFAPKWEFTTRYRNARINFEPAEKWTIFATAGFEQHEYRLDDDAPTSEGVFRDRTIPLTLGATYNASKNFEITAGAGVNFASRLTLDDKTGNRVAQVKVDPSLVVFVNAAVKF